MGTRIVTKRQAERGMLHGLSLMLITLAVFGALVFFAFSKFPVRCACRDGATREGTRSGFDSPDARCEKVCADHGGGSATRREKKAGPR